MWDLDFHSRLDLADTGTIIGGINSFGPTSNLKLRFDRFVWMNDENPKKDLIELKNPELACFVRVYGVNAPRGFCAAWNPAAMR